MAIRGGVTTGVEIWDVPNGVDFGKAVAGYCEIERLEGGGGAEDALPGGAGALNEGGVAVEGVDGIAATSNGLSDEPSMMT